MKDHQQNTSRFSISAQTGQAMSVAVTEGFEDYRLLDSGHGRKLEKFGKLIVDRPELQAIWSPKLPQDKWQAADAVFSGDDEDADQGKWKAKKSCPDAWAMKVMGVTALCRFGAFWHLGIFPEQLPHWQWITDQLKHYSSGEGAPRLLNLFAYTGVASLIAAKAGAEVTHVDASKKAIEWAKESQAQSNLGQAKIRWILDDVRKFTAREVRRGKTYHGILVDPPKFGRGPDGEVWDFFRDVPELLQTCRKLIDPAGGFVIFTSYAIRASFFSIDNLMRDVFFDSQNTIESGELAIREQSGGRLLSTSHFSTWQGKP